MSSLLMIPVPAIKLARKAWIRLSGLLLLGLAGAVALAVYGHQLNRLDDAQTKYKDATAEYSVRTEAIHRLSEMEAAFNRYLLDGNSANLGLLQSHKQRIEQLSQWDADAQRDQLLQSLYAAEQKWYGQFAQPMIEERKKVAAGQGLPEDLLAKYRSSGQDLQVIDFVIAAENAHHQAQQALRQAEDQLRWMWLPYPLAGLLVIGMIWLAAGGIQAVNQLREAAESEGEEEDEVEHPGSEASHEKGEEPR
jgi:hypothetical protein